MVVQADKKTSCKLILVFNPLGALLTANRHAEEYFNLSKSDFGLSIYEKLDLSEGDFKKLISKPTKEQHIWQRSPLSKLFFVEVTHDITGNAILILCFHENEIRSQSNQQLLLLDQLMDDIGIGLWHYDTNTQLAYFSTQLQDIFQLSESEINWSLFRELVYIEDKGVFDVFFRNYFEYEIPLDFDFRVVINKHIKWIRLRGDNLDTQRQEYEVIAGTMMDCTREKETLTALNNAIETRNISMKAGNIGSWRATKDGDDNWTWDWDDLANDMFELDKEDIGNLESWSKRLHPEDIEKVMVSIQHSLETGAFFDEKYRAIMPNGELKYFKGQGQVGQNFRGDICRIDGICIDQTTIVNTERQLQLLNSDLEHRVSIRTKELKREKERAEQASRTKSEFLSMMSHELRTPMNAVIGSLDLLALTAQSLENKELIDTASVSANNLILILNDILDISKIESGKLEIEENEFSIFEVVSNINKIFQPTARAKNISVSVIEDPKVPNLVRGDSVRVRQILFNLIGNAIKFTKSTEERPGGVSLHVAVKEENEHLSYITFGVHDNGIGISNEVQKKLFMPFVQAEKSTTRQYGGTGLGLAICAKLTEMMGGALHLDSEEGKGSSFTVEIPFYKVLKDKAQHLLADRSIVISYSSDFYLDVVNKLKSHLESEKSILTIESIDCLLSEHKNDNNIILLSEDDLKNEDLMFGLLFEMDEKKTMILADHSIIDKVKAKLPGIRILSVNETTRYSIIEHLQKMELVDTIETRDPDSINKQDSSNVNKAPMESSFKNGILVVEDNIFNQTLIKKQLENLGYCCDLAINGKEGLAKWSNNQYRLILTDCHMPEMDGYQMSKEIRQIEKGKGTNKIPVIAVTGAAMKGDDKRCYDAGMNDFVSKPIKLEKLKQVLDKWYPHE